MDYDRLAIEKIKENAEVQMQEDKKLVEQILSPFQIDSEELIQQVLKKPITINFHPDRFSNNQKIILDNLLEQGYYHGQFHTGTTNGGKTAFVGGQRYVWEQQLFHSMYPESCIDRPKYAALNLFNYLDGASVRFGSCYFVLNEDIAERCTFSYGDSSTNPTTICTFDTFICVLADLFRDVKHNSRLLNQVVSWEQEALAIVLNECNKERVLGRNLDYCIETHIHGNLSLSDDVISLYMDESFQGTKFDGKAKDLCEKYEIELKWIPKREIEISRIGSTFRGPGVPLLADEIASFLGSNEAVMNAALLGSAHRDSELNPQRWQGVGSKSEVFQLIKQLWHTIGYFG